MFYIKYNDKENVSIHSAYKTDTDNSISNSRNSFFDKMYNQSQHSNQQIKNSQSPFREKWSQIKKDIRNSDGLSDIFSIMSKR